jgi:ATP-dependent DNA helicase DinG
MIDKSYGKAIWRSLPPMRRTRVLEAATAFLENLPPPRAVV